MHLHTEEFVRRLYRSLSIIQPDQLCAKSIAAKLQLNIHYGEVSFRFGRYIFMRRSSRAREWQMFGHEVGHFFKHVGNQLNMHYLFRDLQEYQANYFAYHFCVPTFMLDNLREVNINVIMNLFNVEHDFAVRRLEMYKNKHIIQSGVIKNEQRHCQSYNG